MPRCLGIYVLRYIIHKSPLLESGIILLLPSTTMANYIRYVMMISKRRNKALPKSCIDDISNQDVGETARAVRYIPLSRSGRGDP